MAEGHDKLPTKGELDACRRCRLGELATQGVPGEGPRRALADAGIAATEAFITNAVKHFSFEPRGKRRIHKTPAQREVAACHAWLVSELAALRPRVIVALGTTALVAVAGRRMTLTAARAEKALTSFEGTPVVATFHPSAALRAPAEARRRELYDIIVSDLKRAARLAGAAASPA